MYEALALQVGKGGAELVGEQDEAGQVQTVLPHLEEGAKLGRGHTHTITFDDLKKGDNRINVVCVHKNKDPQTGTYMNPQTLHPLPHTHTPYLSEGAELHDDPHRVVCDHTHQLDDMGVVELPHGYWVVQRWRGEG